VRPQDLINTPASDLGPAELEAAAEALARAHGASFSSIVGDDLLGGPSGVFPLIHAVGRASPRAPRLLDLRWGDAGAPKVTLVGKGVCFDTGGLDIKPASNMVAMKKDMGGAGAVLALAHIIMASKLRVRLRVLIPAVENSIDGSAFRPSDVIRSRKGVTVEIGNTDAEGRLVLADALTLADEESPELLIDIATLTGAHRVALGTEIPGVFTDDEPLAAALAAASAAVGDATWRLPLWKPYAPMLASKVADCNNISSGPYGGAITAALFLQKFVSKATAAKGWLHIDENGWTAHARPGYPEGGEPQAIRALYAMLKTRYGAQ
jgi:leucyl aminopeptidase